MADPYTFTFDVEALLSGQEVEKEAPKEGVMKRPAKEAEAKSDTPTESLMTRLATALKNTFPDSPALGATPQGDNTSGRNKALTDWTVSTEAFIPKYRGDIPAAAMLDTPPVSTTDLGPDMGTLSMQDAQEQAAIRSVSGITESLGRPSGTATTEVDGLMSAPDVESESGVSVGGADAATDMYPTQGLMSPPVQDTVSEVDTDTAEPVAEEGEGLMQGPDFYPSNERSIITYARDMYPDNPQAAAALAATIKHEGMKDPVEQIGDRNKRYRLKAVVTGAKTKPILMRRDQVIYSALGYPVKKDVDGNTEYLKKPSKDVNTDAQTALNAAGFSVGKVDGLIGKNSKKQIRLFQKQNELTETGKLDTATLSALSVNDREMDHKGNEIPLHVVPESDKNKFIAKDKAAAVFNVRYNDFYRQPGYKLGNVGDYDFSKYVGRGPIQITGMDMYKKIGDIIGVDLIANPELVSDDLDVSRRATKTYLDLKGFDKKTPDGMIKLINPAKDDILKDRKPDYFKYLEAMK